MLACLQLPARRPAGSVLLLLWLCGIAGACLAGERGLPPTEAIPNFGMVSTRLYRGAQPDALGLKHLERLGIKTIINLRNDQNAWKREETEARAYGINYTNIPLPGFARPGTDVVKHILAIVNQSPGPVFIHCEHGCDRTGTIVACYRIQHDRWTAREALREAKIFGMSKFERGMKNFVQDFAKSVRKTAPETARANGPLPMNLDVREQPTRPRTGTVREPAAEDGRATRGVTLTLVQGFNARFHSSENSLPNPLPFRRGEGGDALAWCSVLVQGINARNLRGNLSPALSPSEGAREKGAA